MAIPKYPATFPYPLLADYAYTIGSGVIRTPMESGAPRQRRRWRNMPHAFNLSFAVKVADLDLWQSWINANGYDWFEIDLVTNQTGVTNLCASPHYVRFTSDLSVAALTPKVLKISVNAELSQVQAGPPVPDYGVWIIGGTPAAPSLDFMVGGTPAAPSPNITNPGVPSAPAVIV